VFVGQRGSNAVVHAAAMMRKLNRFTDDSYFRCRAGWMLGYGVGSDRPRMMKAMMMMMMDGSVQQQQQQQLYASCPPCIPVRPGI